MGSLIFIENESNSMLAESLDTNKDNLNPSKANTIQCDDAIKNKIRERFLRELNRSLQK